MRLRVKLFAVARERVGTGAVDVELPAGATVRQLRSAIVETCPPLADVIGHMQFAVNSDYAGDATELSPGTEIAIIPPVSGG